MVQRNIHFSKQLLQTAGTIQRRCLATVETHSTSSSSSQSPLIGMGMGGTSSRLSNKAKKEGDIGSVFASLSGEKETELPERFLHLKRSIIGDEVNQMALKESWGRLITRLNGLSNEIEKKKQACIPQITFDELTNPNSSNTAHEKIKAIKKTGTVVIKGVVSEEQATKWLNDLKEYIKLNPSVKGFPADDKQVFELYWSKPQLEARSHPRSLATQKALLSLFSSPKSNSSNSEVSLTTPLTYADRLRIRHPGDARFALGPHMDGGSIERWEDDGYRSVYGKILSGKWEEFDAWEIEKRVIANQMIYEGAGTCGTFRAFQGWTSLSHTAPTEGTLRVYPYLKEMSAYVLLRPLFKSIISKSETSSKEQYLSAENWELDFESSRFPGAPLARGQELNDDSHPHLELNRTMISVPEVKPGDQVFWHCDTIHAVESEHRGKGPAAVMYIPAVPFTRKNLEYVKDQKEAFLDGRPAPDFPGGVGESLFEGRGKVEDILTKEGLTAMGF